MTQSVAAPVTRELIEQVYKRVGVRIKQGYGLSETSPCLYQGSWDAWDVDIDSVGALLPNIEVKICEPFNSSLGDMARNAPRELGQGDIGELYVKGPNVFSGYFGNDDATDDCLLPIVGSVLETWGSSVSVAISSSRTA
jgi:4-coumarate--CoA ligase